MGYSRCSPFPYFTYRSVSKNIIAYRVVSQLACTNTYCTGKPTLNKRAEAKQEMRAKILSAARKAFSELGFEGTSFKTITDLCDAGKQLQIYHFKNKDELWKEAVISIRNDFFEKFLEYSVCAENISDIDRHKTLTRAFIKANVEVPEYGKMILREGVTPSDRIEWFHSKMQPAEVENPGFESAAYAEAWSGGLGAHLQAGALFYLTQATALSAVHKGNERYAIDPISEETIERVAELMVLMIDSLAKEL